MNLRIRLIVAALLAAMPCAAQHIDRDSLQHIVTARVTDGRSTGLIVGVITPSGARWTASAGNERPGKPVDAQTIFEIGSVTKTSPATPLAGMIGPGELPPH